MIARRLPLALLPLLLLLGAASPAPAPRVVELYQSQGCSSCPPAIANVNRLADRPDLIVLDFAVTYWDRLGWKDSFAKPAFTQRQWAYANGAGRAQVSTPQVIVDGRGVGVGGRADALAALIAGTPRDAGPPLAVTGGQVSVGPARGAVAADVWLVRYDPRPLKVAIGAGENGGRTLVHRNVVRDIVRLGGWSGAPVRLALPPTAAPLKGAVLVQAAKGGAILAAART